MADPHANAGGMSLLLCRLGTVVFAVPAQAVAQAIPRPRDLQAMPRRDGALEGVFQHRARAVPLVNLRLWLPWPDSAEPATQVLLLRSESGWLGVAVDALVALRTVDGRSIQALSHGDAPEELFSGAVRVGIHRDDEPQAVPLLDVPALFRLSRCWSAGHHASTPLEGGRSTATGHETWAVLHRGTERLALPARLLRAVDAVENLQTLGVAQQGLLGVARWRDRDVPLYEPPSIQWRIGHEAAPEARRLAAMVEFQGHCVGIRVDGVHTIQALDLSQLQAPEAVGLSAGGGVLGVMTLGDGVPVTVLDAEALVSACRLRELFAGATQAVPVADRSSVSAGEVSDQAWMVVSAGGLLAVPLSQLEHVTPLKSLLGTLPATWGDATTATQWRGQTVALQPLAGSMDPAAALGSGAVALMAKDARGHIRGWLVEQLHSLLPARTAHRSVFRHLGAGTTHMVSVGRGHGSRSFRVVDLHQMPVV